MSRGPGGRRELRAALIVIGVVGAPASAVAQLNHLPVANADAASTHENTILTVSAPGVLDNDTDEDAGDVLSVVGHDALSALGAPVTVESDGAFTYDPRAVLTSLAQGASVADTFRYTITDGTAATAMATVTVTVAGRNDAPVAVMDTVAVDEDGSVDIAVLDNDTDVDDGAVLQLQSVTAPAVGSAVDIGGGVVRFTPLPNYFGPLSFTYRVGDEHGANSTGTVSVMVRAQPDPPTARDDTASTDEDMAVVIDVVDNDFDVDGDALGVMSVTTPANGAAVIGVGGTVVYTPDPDFHGTDGFDYTVGDGTGRFDLARVTITVRPVDDAPAATDDVYDVPAGGLTVGAPGVLANDVDAESASLTALLVDDVPAGTLVLGSDGSVSYVPAAGVFGDVTFRYRASDGSLSSNLATVTLRLPDAGDAGAPEVDAGSSSLDAGAPEVDAGDFDAGSALDAGAPVLDAGDVDAGPASFDAGAPARDAGPARTDTGVPSIDAEVLDGDAATRDAGLDAGGTAGCSCRTAPSSRGPGGVVWLFALALVLRRRR